MNVWAYLFFITLFITIILIIKTIMIKKETKNIIESLNRIINSDTNNLITLNSNNRELKNLVINLNKNLKILRKLELEYKNGNHMLKSSITNISHDLRTPLTAIRGYLDLLETDNLNKKQINHLKIIDNKIENLIELTNQLFDFSKSLDLEEEKNKKDICINDILIDTIASFYGLFKKNRIEPKIEICKNKIIKNLDESMLKRIFENIISNAIKYGKKDLEIELLNDGKIRFSNETDDFDSTSLEKIFDRYYTVKNVRKSNGIGLSIAKQLVELNGGTIKSKYYNNYLIIEIEF